MSRVYILFIIIFLQACTGINKDNINDNEINVEREIGRIFNGYDYDFMVGMNRGFVKYYSVVLQGDSLSLKNFERIKGKIEKKWKLVYFSEDQYVFCYDQYNEMTVIHPKKMDYYDKFGQKLYIKSDDLNKWGVGVVYREGGTSYCKDVEF